MNRPEARRVVTLALLVAGYLAAMAVTGCTAETRQKILPFFFDGVPGAPGEKGSGKPGPPPPTRRVRRDLLQEIEQLKRELLMAQEAAKAKEKGLSADAVQRPAEKAKTWQEVAGLLPKDAVGGVDWMQAIKAGAIRPRPGLDAQAPEQATLELDVELASSPSKAFSMTFPHAGHTRWLGCGNCHPAVYPLKRGAPPPAVTMAKMEAGQSCGVCHGPVTFGVKAACHRCHTKIPAKSAWRPAEEPRKPIERAKTWAEAAKLLPVTGDAPDWAKALASGVIAPRPGLKADAKDEDILDQEVVRVPDGNEAAKTIFPHKAHTELLKCDDCHAGTYEMQTGATAMSMEKLEKGQLCATCHGKVAFPVEACGRCHPAM